MYSSAVSEQESGVADSSVRDLSNDALIIRLIQTVNHLSRWLTPIHDRTVLEFSPRRSEPSVKELLLRMRDTETRVYGFMNAIASERDPDLDRIPRVEPSPVADFGRPIRTSPGHHVGVPTRARELDIPAAGSAR